MDATKNRKRADTLKAARYANLTSSNLTYNVKADEDAGANMSEQQQKLLIVGAGNEIKDIPNFETFAM